MRYGLDFIVGAGKRIFGEGDLGEIGAIGPSSDALGEMMVRIEEIANANVIVELGAGTGAFTKFIFERAKPTAKIFIIEKDPGYCKDLKERFPDFADRIFCIDAQEIEAVLQKDNIKTVDLIISGIPFNSLKRKERAFATIQGKRVFGKFVSEQTVYKQFTYSSTGRLHRLIETLPESIQKRVLTLVEGWKGSDTSNVRKYRKYWDEVTTEVCDDNTLKTLVLTCTHYNRKVGYLMQGEHSTGETEHLNTNS